MSAAPQENMHKVHYHDFETSAPRVGHPFETVMISNQKQISIFKSSYSKL